MAKVSVKDKVLEMLDGHKGTYYSGQDLAEQLQVSRTAIWKAITNLRNEGYEIEGSTKLGYCMAENTDVLHKEKIQKSLSKEAQRFYRVETVKTIDSTNLAVRERGICGEAEGLCIVAEEQTAGKGRRGKSFASPKTTGVYLSILLRPQLSFEKSVLITTAAAAAAARACEQVNENLAEKEVQIKWVNDLFLNNRKICGILTEGFLSMETRGLDYAVMGIGFNLCPPEQGWPEEIEGIAGSLFEERYPAGSRNRLVSAFLNEFLPYYQNLEERAFLEEYRSRQLAMDKDVVVLEADGSKRNAHVIGVDDMCQLLVRYEGTEEIFALNSGEISVKL